MGKCDLRNLSKAALSTRFVEITVSTQQSNRFYRVEILYKVDLRNVSEIET